MRTHVFIVNNDTFPSHLKYLFAGTGAGDKDEHIGLLSDIKRVRPGDFALFYIEATTKEKGGFYGIFKIAKQNPLVFQVTGKNGLKPDLGKKLIYRTLIEPYEVYSEGVPEWEALDKLPVYATEIQWSLIYRKLKAKRGCTPILPWESERIIEMIRNKNKGKQLADNSFKGGFDWEVSNRRIVTTKLKKKYPYLGKFQYSVLQDICTLQQRKRAHEIHLQTYFTENIGFDKNLSQIVGNNVVWFGNEVACGVGMQKIDVLIINEVKSKREFRIIELKDEAVDPIVVEQIEYYVSWTSQDSGRHLDGAFNWNIQPIIVATPCKPQKLQAVIQAFKNFNSKKISLPILYFEFTVECGKSIIFKQKKY